MRTATIAIALALSLAACHKRRTPIIPPPPSQEEVSALSDLELRERLHLANGRCRNLIRYADRQDVDDCYNLIEHERSYGTIGGELARRHPGWSDRLLRSLRTGGGVTTGMTAAEVRMLLGDPDDMNITRLPNLTRYQLIYGEDLSSRRYVYIENDIVTAIQE